MRRLQLPRCSVRQDTTHMAGAIFMSNSETREHCFGAGVFGLPPEYEHFVVNVRQGMPLFLFDYTERKLYGVFEATSDGGMDIHRGAFRSSGRTYPAQVCFNIVWKCKPITEDELFPAIEDNYYSSKKFYFDLSYQQVVNLYGLFDKKRVHHPISNYSTRAHLEKEHSIGGRPDRRSLSPNTSPQSANQSQFLITSNCPAVETNCSASTNMHPIVPHSSETQPNVSVPLVSEPFGVQTAPVHSSQLKLPYHPTHEHLRDISTIDSISTQVSAPYSQAASYQRDQFDENQRDLLSHDYRRNSSSSGYITQGPTDGARLSVKLPYEGSSSLYSRYVTQVPTGDDRSYLSPYVPSYPHLPQHNANLEDDYHNCEQCKAMYASEHQHSNNGKFLPELTQQAAISQQKESFTGYIPDSAEDFEKEQRRHDFNRDGSGSSGSGNDTGRAYISDRPYTNDDAGAESNMPAPSQRPRKTVFSRMSMKQQPPPQEIPGPSLNQLLYSLSKRTEQWSSTETSPAEYVCKQLVREQVIDRPYYAPAELNLPSGLEQEEENFDPPFLNFKRRSKATSLDSNVGVRDNKGKRRKLIRPSFGPNNKTASPGKELQENGVTKSDHSPVETVGNKPHENVAMEMNHCSVQTFRNKQQEDLTMEMNHSPLETTGSKFFIDLNEPASLDSDLVEDGSTEPSPAAIVKTQTEKPSEANTHKPSCSSLKEEISEHNISSSDNGAPTEKVTLDLNITDLNTMDDAKLQAILGSSLLQALDKLRNGKSNNDSEKATKPSLCAKNGVVKMEMKHDTGTNRRCN